MAEQLGHEGEAPLDCLLGLRDCNSHLCHPPLLNWISGRRRLQMGAPRSTAHKRHARKYYEPSATGSALQAATSELEPTRSGVDPPRSEHQVNDVQSTLHRYVETGIFAQAKTAVGSSRIDYLPALLEPENTARPNASCRLCRRLFRAARGRPAPLRQRAASRLEIVGDGMAGLVEAQRPSAWDP